MSARACFLKNKISRNVHGSYPSPVFSLGTSKQGLSARQPRGTDQEIIDDKHRSKLFAAARVSGVRVTQCQHVLGFDAAHLEAAPALAHALEIAPPFDAGLLGEIGPLCRLLGCVGVDQRADRVRLRLREYDVGSGRIGRPPLRRRGIVRQPDRLFGARRPSMFLVDVVPSSLGRHAPDVRWRRPLAARRLRSSACGPVLLDFQAASSSWRALRRLIVDFNGADEGNFVELARQCDGVCSSGERVLLHAILYVTDFAWLADELGNGYVWRNMDRASGDYRLAVAACIGAEAWGD
jgi:hypothetical protein